MLKLRTKQEMIKEFALRFVIVGQETPKDGTRFYLSPDSLPFEITYTPIQFTEPPHSFDRLVCFYCNETSADKPAYYALESELHH